MQTKEAIERIARRFTNPWTRGYVRGKMQSDPAYQATLELVRDSPLPLLDIGCGMGLLAFYLREHGYNARMIGLDFDAAKIATAKAMHDYADLEFRVEDAAQNHDFSGNIAILDVLQYIETDKQIALLHHLPNLIPPDGKLILRATPRDNSWRFRITLLADRVMHTLRWMKSPVVNYLPIEQLTAPLINAGFQVEIAPLWGKTPFNSHLFVFSKPSVS